MTRNEFLILFAICIIWGFHFVVIKVTVEMVPPLFYAAMRMCLLAIVLSPLLRIYKGRMLRIFVAGMCLGGLNFGFLFLGLQYASPSAAAIAIELSIPFATVLSVIFLGERVRWRRTVGIAMAFAGICIIAFKPGEADLSLGVGLVALAALFEASGAVLVKSLKGVPPLRLQAWAALIGACVLSLGTSVFETGGIAAVREAGLLFYGALAYSVFLSSLVGHTSFYWLLQRRDISQIAPGLILTPILAAGFGVWLTGDTFTPVMAVGAAVSLLGVFIVMVRSGPKSPVVESAGGT
ncbi:MAG: DMT family transporter [Pseudomonadota bacterium]